MCHRTCLFTYRKFAMKSLATNLGGPEHSSIPFHKFWRIAFRICCSKTVDKSEFQSLFRTPSPATSTCQERCTTACSHFPHSIFPGFFVAWCRPAHGSADHLTPGRRLLNETVSVSQPPILNCWLAITITSFDHQVDNSWLKFWISQVLTMPKTRFYPLMVGVWSGARNPIW